MSNAPQTQPAQKGQDFGRSNNTAQAATTPKKDEPTVKSGEDRMKNEGGGCSSSDKKSTQGGCD